MGKLLILSGSSGSGKTTVCGKLLELFPAYRFSVSATSRRPRHNEKDGVDYHFYSHDEFKKLIDEGKLAEWEEVHGNMYGTLKETIEKALLEESGGLLLDVDPKGALHLKELYPEAVTIFLRAESIETLIKRLEERKTESQEEIAKRMERYREELPLSKKFDFVLINKDIDRTVFEIASLIRRMENTQRE